MMLGQELVIYIYISAFRLVSKAECIGKTSHIYIYASAYRLVYIYIYMHLD